MSSTRCTESVGIQWAVYVINPDSLKRSKLSEFKRIRKYEMDELHSLDLDTLFDWKIAELLLSEEMV